MRLLTSRTPTGWRDLQKEVANILTDCGFQVYLEKSLKSVRGNVELDVYGEEVIDGRTYRIACECKHWANNVPQREIHAFRTVVADIGANIGYLISSNGFQSGSFKASELTNIQLVTWPQFQDAFSETWVQKCFRPRITEQLDKLFNYTEPLVPRWMLEIPEHEVPTVKQLRDKYERFGWLVLTFSIYHVVGRPGELPALPLREHLAATAGIPDAVLDAGGYRDLLNEVLAFGTTAIGEFDMVRKRNNV